MTRPEFAKAMADIRARLTEERKRVWPELKFSGDANSDLVKAEKRAIVEAAVLMMQALIGEGYDLGEFIKIAELEPLQ